MKKVLVCGASGFIGSYVTAMLVMRGYEVVCGVRDVERTKLKFPSMKVIKCEFNRSLTVKKWMQALDKIDYVVNVVGVLNSASGNDIDDVHNIATIALFEACKKKGIAKLIHISALGIDDEHATLYSKTKRKADEHLQAMKGLNWVILKPSLVYAAGCYGGTSLFRALAALPIVPLIGNGLQKFQPIHIDDVCEVIKNLLEQKKLPKKIIKIAGPDVVSVKELLKGFRKMLGLKPAWFIKIPICMINIASKIGDLFKWSTVNSTAVAMMKVDNVADIDDMIQQTGVIPRGFEVGIGTTPLTVQSLWHAKLYFLSPCIRVLMGILWFFSGFNCMFLAPEMAMKYLLALGFDDVQSLAYLVGGSVVDMILGVLLIFRVKVIEVAVLQILMVIIYTIALSILDPSVWFDPLGAVVKNLPVVLCTFVLMATLREK